MVNKNQILVFMISFLTVGFSLLSKPELGFSGVGCCADLVTGICTTIGETTCEGIPAPTVWCEGGTCISGTECSIPCPPPQIPTLNQWGKIITMAVIGLFAVIGLIAMRRRKAVKLD